MGVLNGLTPPCGDGLVIEVHLDIVEAASDFLHRLTVLGFESDPFIDFHPEEYRHHYTGRTRALQSEVNGRLPAIRELIEQVLCEARQADVKLYVESELVREIHHFECDGSTRTLSAFDSFAFAPSRENGAAKADIHVEFVSGTVPGDVRALLISNCFYWVRTPRSQAFPSEEIATLQTSSFRGAQMVYERLVADPLPGCTGIHLEQKLAMSPSHPDLAMPSVIDVTRHRGDGIAAPAISAMESLEDLAAV